MVIMAIPFPTLINIAIMGTPWERHNSVLSTSFMQHSNAYHTKASMQFLYHNLYSHFRKAKDGVYHKSLELCSSNHPNKLSRTIGKWSVSVGKTILMKYLGPQFLMGLR